MEVQTETYRAAMNGTLERHFSDMIAVIPKVSGIPYFNAVEEGVLEAGKDLNVHVLYAGPLIADWQQQEQLVKEYIERKYPKNPKTPNTIFPNPFRIEVVIRKRIIKTTDVVK